MELLIIVIVGLSWGVLTGALGDRYNIPKRWQYVMGGVGGSLIGLAANIISRS